MKTDTDHRYAVVVAGGSGTRLWPLSRQNLPKQMQKFISDKPLIRETVDRLTGVVPIENIYISTTANYAKNIKELIPQIPAENIIVEPLARGTSSAFALFASTIARHDPEAIIYSLASDHAVTGSEEFHATILRSFTFVENHPQHILLVGIKPTNPDTGMGYIKIGESIQTEPAVYNVEKFIEKPALKVAQNYLASDQFYWNAAYYCFRATTLLAAYGDDDPEIIKHIDAYLATGNEDEYMKVPAKAQEIEFIDSNKFPLAILPANFKWSDIGNWQALHALLAEFTNSDMVHSGENHIDVNSSNCLVFSTDKRLIATVGLDNIAIVSTDDAVLILNKEQTQDVKKLLESLKDAGMKEYL
jgi:mannose-1-phosphate guanylyltransferase